jgi:hypothetical protein
MEQIQHLVDCTELNSLTMTGNEVALLPGYRYEVSNVLKKLQYLDDLPVTNSDRSRKKSLRPNSASTQSTIMSMDSVAQRLSQMNIDVEYVLLPYYIHE